MRIAASVVAGLFTLCALTGCDPTRTSDAGSSTSARPTQSAVHFDSATLARDSSIPTPGGPNLRVSGKLVSKSDVGVDAGAIKAYVLDGPSDRKNSPVTTIEVRDGTFARSFRVIGPGGSKIRLDYVVDGKVLASTVVKY